MHVSVLCEYAMEIRESEREIASGCGVREDDAVCDMFASNELNFEFQ